LCDGVDNDCNGVIDDGATCERRPDPDGVYGEFPVTLVLYPLTTANDDWLGSNDGADVTIRVTLSGSQGGLLVVEADVTVDEVGGDDSRGAAHQRVSYQVFDGPVEIFGGSIFDVEYNYDRGSVSPFVDEACNPAGLDGYGVEAGPVVKSGAGAPLGRQPGGEELEFDAAPTDSDSVVSVRCNNLFAVCDANNANGQDGQMSSVRGDDGEYLYGHAYCEIVIDPYFRATPVCGVGDGNGLDEICDGIDNDCDGDADNAPVDVGRPCGLTDVGECTFGASVCNEGGVLVCEGEIGPMEEVCNGKDDDCDGLIDEARIPCESPCGPGSRSCRDHPSTCFDDCPEGVISEKRYRRCDLETRIFGACTALSCDGQDDDDDGVPDNGSQVCDTGCTNDAEPVWGGRRCNDPVQACFQLGHDGVDSFACEAGQNGGYAWSEAPVEVCDGADNNGNIEADEGPIPCLTLCGPGHSTCSASCEPGDDDCMQRDVCRLTECDGGEPCVCLPDAVGVWGSHTCDEDVVARDGVALALQDRHCEGSEGGHHFSGTLECEDRGGQWVATCNATNQPSPAEICDDLDNDGDGLVDEQRQLCDTGCGAGTRSCLDPELACFKRCRTDLQTWGFRACGADGEWGDCDAESCDNLDNNGNGTVDEGPIPVQTACGPGLDFCGDVHTAPVVLCQDGATYGRCTVNEDGAATRCVAGSPAICEGQANGTESLPPFWVRFDCPGCNVTCAVPEGVDECADGTLRCDDGALVCRPWAAGCQ
jgi:hypothetical protein